MKRSIVKALRESHEDLAVQLIQAEFDLDEFMDTLKDSSKILDELSKALEKQDLLSSYKDDIEYVEEELGEAIKRNKNYPSSIHYLLGSFDELKDKLRKVKLEQRIKSRLDDHIDKLYDYSAEIKKWL